MAPGGKKSTSFETDDLMPPSWTKKKTLSLLPYYMFNQSDYASWHPRKMIMHLDVGSTCWSLVKHLKAHGWGQIQCRRAPYIVSLYLYPSIKSIYPSIKSSSIHKILIHRGATWSKVGGALESPWLGRNKIYMVGKRSHCN